MQCKQCRAELHNWFDTSGGAPLPESVSSHIRSCHDCLGFVQQWNNVELSLQTMRSDAPDPAGQFISTLRDRVSSDIRNKRRTFQFNYGPRFALASSLLLIIGILIVSKFTGLANSGLQMFGLGSNPNVAATSVNVRPADNTHSSDFNR